MDDFFLELDRHRNALQRLAAVAKRTDGGHFADLWWSAEDGGIDAMLAVSDVLFVTADRMFALGFIKSQLRYWAGPNPDSGIVYAYETGCFEDMEVALRFAEEYLVNKTQIPAIAVPRRIIQRAEGKAPG